MSKPDALIGATLSKELKITERKPIPGAARNFFYLAENITDVESGNFGMLAGGFGSSLSTSGKTFWRVEIGTAPANGLASAHEIRICHEPLLKEGIHHPSRFVPQCWRAVPQRGETLTDRLHIMEQKDWPKLVREIGISFHTAHSQGYVWGQVCSEHIFFEGGTWKLRPTLYSAISSLAHPQAEQKKDLTAFLDLIIEICGDFEIVTRLQIVSERLKSEQSATLADVGASEVAVALAPSFGTMPELEIRRMGDDLVFSLPPHQLGNYELIRLTAEQSPPDLPFLSKDITAFGESVTSLRSRMWRSCIQKGQVERFSLLQQSNGVAQLGKPCELSWLPDVTNLSAYRDGDGIILSWDWPPTVLRALLKVSSTHRKETFRITKPNYLLENGFVYPLGLSVPEEEIHFQVLAASLRRGNEFFHSPGIEASCRTAVRLQ
jgi:hypothetical protein